MLNQNHSPQITPSLFCGWTVSNDGKKLIWDGTEKFRFFPEWLTFLQEHFFKLWGRTLEGHLRWSGEDPKDKGFLVVNADQSISALDRHSPEGEAFMLGQQRLKTIQAEKRHFKEVLPESILSTSRKMKL